MTYKELFKLEIPFYFKMTQWYWFYYPKNNDKYYMISIDGYIKEYTYEHLRFDVNIINEAIQGEPEWAKHHSLYQKLKHDKLFNKKIGDIIESE